MTYPASIAAALCLLASGAAQASVVNGGFENGLAGWDTIGSVLIDTGDLESGPVEGDAQAEILNGTDAVSDTELEAFLGAPTGALDAAYGDVVNGAAISQTVDTVIGQTLTFRFNYLTAYRFPPLTINDRAFLYVDGTLVLLAQTLTPGLDLAENGFFFETGFSDFSYSVTTAGPQTLGFGVVNVGDEFNGSLILLDAVRIAPIPLPATLPALFGALALVAGLARRRA